MSRKGGTGGGGWVHLKGETAWPCPGFKVERSWLALGWPFLSSFEGCYIATLLYTHTATFDVQEVTVSIITGTCDLDMFAEGSLLHHRTEV